MSADKHDQSVTIKIDLGRQMMNGRTAHLTIEADGYRHDEVEEMTKCAGVVADRVFVNLVRAEDDAAEEQTREMAPVAERPAAVVR